jgi:hypothetical protein
MKCNSRHNSCRQNIVYVKKKVTARFVIIAAFRRNVMPSYSGGTIPETLMTMYHSTRRNIPEHWTLQGMM